MITYSDGDIFQSGCDILVDPVNCRGAAGGLAKAFRYRYPSMFRFYERACQSRELRIGHPLLYDGQYPAILLFPVKDDWRIPARLDHIEAGLEATEWLSGRVESIAFPALGCGMGLLSWHAVQPIMERFLAPLENQIIIYYPK